MPVVIKTDVASSVPFDNEGITFNSDNVQDAIEEAKSDALALPRFSIIANHNGTLSDGQLVGYSNLLNNPIVIPVKCQLEEVTMYNNSATADADYRFYKDTEVPGNLFYTWELTNTQTAVVDSSSFDSEPVFLAGDLLRVYFDKTGGNTSDLSMGFFFKVVE